MKSILFIDYKKQNGIEGSTTLMKVTGEQSTIRVSLDLLEKSPGKHCQCITFSF